MGLVHLLDEREVGATRVPVAQIGARAVSELIRTYGEVRRMLAYVRWFAARADRAVRRTCRSIRARPRRQTPGSARCGT